MWAGEAYITTDAGMNWDDVSKAPTGDYLTNVEMEADVVWGGEVFDPDEGKAFASTWGDESAVSRSNDGGERYNQVGYIDSAITWMWDIAIHPDFPDEATYLLLTHNTVNDTDSLWITENGDEDEPDYIRTLCGSDGGPGNFGSDELWWVEYSADLEAIYLAGIDDDPEVSSIWKSTNDGQSFGSERDVKDNAYINDWVITDDKTIYAATDEDGFYKTTNSGLSWTGTDVGGSMHDIDMSPDFEDGEGYILLGGHDGQIMLSDDDGDSFDDAEDEEQSGLTDGDIGGGDYDVWVNVAFDADFADEDADGYMYIYAASDVGDEIQKGKIADTDDVDWSDLKDKSGEDTQELYCTGLEVAADNALYALSTGGGAAAGDIEADGTLDLEGDTSGTTEIVNIPDTDISVTSGTFEDEESLTITLADLTAATATSITGTLYLEGDDSGATGTIAISETVTGPFTAAEDVSVTGDSLWAEVAGSVAG
jgi:hypothetical protein